MTKETRHLISMDDVDLAFIYLAFRIAKYYMGIIEGTASWLALGWYTFRRIVNCLPLAGKIIASVFYEPSTRTRFSFEAAAWLLGGMVIGTENAKEFSSAAKGETTKDSTKVTSGYVKAIVMRHFKEGSAKEARKVSRVPIINGGDGTGEHPTQTLLDLFTIWIKFGRIDGLTIAMIGDIKHGRTIHSLAKGLCLFENIRMIFVSSKQLAMEGDLRDYLQSHNANFEEYENLREAPLDDIDVFYVTRVQKERFPDQNEYELVKDHCIVSIGIVALIKKEAIIMHPLPRVNEIPEEIDDDPRAVYFDQARYGLYVRMAILDILLNHLF